MRVLMIFLIGISTIFSLKINPELKDKWLAIVEPFKDGCIKTTGIMEEIADTFFVDFELREDYPFKCYVKCIEDNLHVFDESGKFNSLVMKEIMDDTSFKIAEDCYKS